MEDFQEEKARRWCIKDHVCNTKQLQATNFARAIDKIASVAYNKYTQQMQHERLETIKWITRRKWF